MHITKENLVPPIEAMLDLGFARRFLYNRTLRMGEVNRHERNGDTFYLAGTIDNGVKSQVNTSSVFPPEFEVTEFFKLHTVDEAYFSAAVEKEQERVALSLRKQEDTRFLDLLSAAAQFVQTKETALTPTLLQELAGAISSPRFSPRFILIGRQRLPEFILHCSSIVSPTIDRNLVRQGYLGLLGNIWIVTDPASSLDQGDTGVLPNDRIFVLPDNERVGYMHRRVNLMSEKGNHLIEGSEKMKEEWMLYELISQAVRGGSVAMAILAKNS